MSTNQLNPETTFQSVVGRVIVKIRKELNVEQATLASSVGVTQSTWSRIERGESSLTVEQLANAAECLRVNPSTILLEAEEATKALRAQGVVVRNNKIQNSKTKAGIALIGAAALGALVGNAIAKSKNSDA